MPQINFLFDENGGESIQSLIVQFMKNGANDTQKLHVECRNLKSKKIMMNEFSINNL